MQSRFTSLRCAAARDLQPHAVGSTSFRSAPLNRRRQARSKTVGCFQVLFRCALSGWRLSPSPSRRRRPFSPPRVVPSEDYSHGGGLADSACFVKGDGQKTHSRAQKKTMKTKIQISSGLGSRSAQRSTGRPRLARIDFTRRRVNRSLDTFRLLNLLRSRTPEFFGVAEVVGKWVWIQFAEKQPASITSQLSELGFHWNNTRQAWQHPCGLRRSERATVDPRQYFGSYFAADMMTA